MKLREPNLASSPILKTVVSWLTAGMLLVPCRTLGSGTWAPLVGQPPNGVGLMLLLTDGSVLAASRVPSLTATFPPSGPSRGWYRLHPDPQGHYVAGLWTVAATMNDTRLYYASAVLQDGRVLVAGGEYGTGSATSEIYDPVNDTWTRVSVPAGAVTLNSNPPPGQNKFGFSDSGSIVIANGNVMVAPVYPITPNGTLIFNPSLNAWRGGPTNIGNQNEASWVKLPDGSILTVDAATTNSERFIPSLNRWIADANLPVSLYDTNQEAGAALLLPNGKAFFLGGTGKTALYTPSGNTNNGSWVAGPTLPSGFVSADAPAAMMVNGKVLCVASVGYTNGPSSFFEFDPSSGPVGAFTQISNPPFSPSRAGDAPFGDTLLALPDGTILFSHNYGGGLGDGIFIYQPDGTPLASGKPTITGIAPNSDGSYHLTGTLFNGISAGAAYGDDAQMDSNYPLVRLTDAFGNVFYARTHHWSSTGVMTGSRPVTTEFNLPSFLPPGAYKVAAVANGIASDPIALPPIRYVDKNNTCVGPGDLVDPFKTLATFVVGWSWGTPIGLGVTLSPMNPPPGAPSLPCPPPPLPCSLSICLGGPYKKLGDAVSSVNPGTALEIAAGNYNEPMTINKPLILSSHGGSAFIGQP